MHRLHCGTVPGRRCWTHGGAGLKGRADDTWHGTDTGAAGARTRCWCSLWKTIHPVARCEQQQLAALALVYVEFHLRKGWDVMAERHNKATIEYEAPGNLKSIFNTFWFRFFLFSDHTVPTHLNVKSIDREHRDRFFTQNLSKPGWMRGLGKSFVPS